MWAWIRDCLLVQVWTSWSSRWETLILRPRLVEKQSMIALVWNINFAKDFAIFIFQTSRILRSDGSWLRIHCCYMVFIVFFTVKLVFGAIYLDWCILIFALMVWKFKFEKKLYNKLLIWKRSHCFRDVRTVSKLISWKRPPRIDRSLRTHLDHLKTVILGCLSAALKLRTHQLDRFISFKMWSFLSMFQFYFANR